MAATTMMQLLDRYRWQALILADRQAPIDGKDEMLFHSLHLKHEKKLYPRGKTLTNLMKIQREFIKYRRSEEYLQKLCDDYAAKHDGATKIQEEP
ncbi:hypothetical protein [Morganella morganii]|uniref:hypothetical protein n=1 Tax=Morganella morganii TaxID=582 RepID=UPI000BBD1F07|nr:hypothetical protein [Morganella morganii]ATF52615.1 hypothetical protein CO693_02310 [Morganella morganii]ATF52920.1 hypothetical protein CO693_03960 [Morganella morganii]